MRLNTFFYLSHLIFCNSNSAASSTMHGETYGGGQVVPSLMVMENGAIRFVCMIFLIPHHSKHRVWMQATMDTSHSTSKKRVAPHFYGDGEQASEGGVVGMVLGLADAHGWMSVGCYFVLCLVKGNIPHEVL